MDADVVDLTRTLCEIPSPTGAEGAVVNAAADLLGSRGYRVVRQAVTPGRDNLLAFRALPTVVLSTHLDTVPPYIPFREDDAWVAGRGTVDAKGIAAAMIVAADRLHAEGISTTGILLLVGEEDGSDGALAAAQGDLEPRGRVLVNGEPTENRLVIGQKGALRVLLEAKGRAAHSAYPEEGESAVEALLDTLERIRAIPLPTDPMLGPATMNIGRIEGGIAPNVIPPTARSELLIRIVGDPEALQAAIRAAAHPRVHVSFPLVVPPARGEPLNGWEVSAVSYTSDWPLLLSWGARYQLGPGSIRVAHTAEERIRKDELHRGVAAYMRLVRQLGEESAA